MKALSVVVTCLLAALAGCGSISPGAKFKMSDPDRRAGELTAAWTRALTDSQVSDLPKENESLRLTMIRLLDEAEILALEHPRHVQTLMLCAGLSYDLSHPDNAQAYLDALFDVDPTHAEAAVLRSRIALEQGNHPYAVRLLDEQVELNPDHSGVREARAAALYMAERYHEAARDLQAAERLGTPKWRTAFNLGLISEAEGRLEDAARYYGECISIRPDYTPAAERMRGLESARAVPIRPPR